MKALLAVLATAATAASLPARWTPERISSDQYESSPSFAPDGRSMIFMRANPQFSAYRLMQSHCGPQGWSAPQPLSIAAPLPASEADPFITADGRQLWFVSNRPFPGKQGDDLDIWVSEKTSDGHDGWGPPRRLPEPINSAQSELLPRRLPDGRLFFGSDRPGGLGGNDVYMATPQADGSWRVANLGAPLNTASNDYEVEMSADGNQAVVVSDREGRSHLYRYARDGKQGWRPLGRVPARDEVFQVGPLLSPKADRLLFAQADGPRSGELFLIDLQAGADPSWPPACPAIRP
jgi:Tol biopolymer transport system component